MSRGRGTGRRRRRGLKSRPRSKRKRRRKRRKMNGRVRTGTVLKLTVMNRAGRKGKALLGDAPELSLLGKSSRKH